MSRPRQQHYVTRAYLEGFVSPNEKHLHVYTRGNAGSFKALPENVAKIHNYYSAKKEDGTYEDRLEHLLQTHIEDPGLAVIKRLIAGHYNISRDARLRLSVLLAIQEYRVPWMREQMGILMQGMMERHMGAAVKAPGVLESLLKEHALADEDDVGRMAAEMRRGLQEGEIKLSATPTASLHAMAYALDILPNIYFSMGWEVLETRSIPFIKSDCPVYIYYVPVRRDLPHCGLMDKRVQIRFPLCQTKLLVVRHDRKRLEMIDALRARRGERAAPKAANRASEIRHVRISATDVAIINADTASMASKFVFSPVALTNAAELLKGECQNVRQELIDHPDGSTEFRTVYPQLNRMR